MIKLAMHTETVVQQSANGEMEATLPLDFYLDKNINFFLKFLFSVNSGHILIGSINQIE